MRVMVMIRSTASCESDELPDEELMAEMGKFNEELMAAGLMKGGEGLKPSSEGARVHFDGKQRTVTAGPFPETHELIAGYWIWEVDSLEQAIEWVKRCPNPLKEACDLEIRPIFEVEDFAPSDPSGAIREQEQGLLHQLALRESMTQPYLFFGGRCEEALEFYEAALGARIEMKMRFEESPVPHPEGMVPEGFEKKIMHASFCVGDLILMASDGCGEASGFQGFSLALTVPDVETCDRVIEALADGGSIDLPAGETFWSPRYGQVTDRFGIRWMVMVKGEES